MGTALLVLWAELSACGSLAPAAARPSATAPAPVRLTILADGRSRSASVPPNMTVREALAQAGLAVGELDRLDPPPFTRVTEGLTIQLVRVTETFETEQAVLPFASEVVKTEGLAAGERRLLQPGSNGLEEITYRTVFEDGIQIGRSVVKRVTLQPAQPEIILVGSQASFTIVPITGTFAYLSGQNGWLVRENSGQRRPLTFSGDLDGRVFDLSPDGQWLLFSRATTDTTSALFNSLWAVSTTTALTNVQPIALPVSNSLYAEWSPIAARTLAYSTAEKINRAPGWQANNDLWLVTWDDVTSRRTRLPERVFTATQVLDSSSGGLYGWWGTGFAFAPDGARIAYARTDSIGLVDLATFGQSELTRFTAYNSRSEWAWYPSLSWAPDGEQVYSVIHGQPLGLEAPEDSPAFHLAALTLQGMNLELIPRAGMFANPQASPRLAAATAEQPHQIAFLQALEPSNSPFSRYRLGVMDRDGSNLRFLFPPEDQPGLEASADFAWSPDGRLLAVVYEGNLWLVDAASGVSQQLTGDSLTSRAAWSR